MRYCLGLLSTNFPEMVCELIMTYNACWVMLHYSFKGRELRFGRSLLPFMMESGSLENVMDMVPTVCCSQDQMSTPQSTVVDGKMERSMYVFESVLHTV